MPSSAPQSTYPETGFDSSVATVPPTLEALCQLAAKLPCSPVLLPRLVAAIRNDRTSLSDLEDLIRLDPAMAAEALRTANSAAYGSGVPLDDIGQALMRLGLHEIFRLASLTSLRRWEQFHEDRLPWRTSAFSRHSYAFAKAAEFLAQRFTSEVDPMVAYSAGLVANIGKLATGYVCAAHYPQIRQLAVSMPLAEAERHLLGYSSDEVGLELLRSWRFSPMLTSMLRHRETPTQAPGDELPLMAVLHAAQHVACVVTPETDAIFGMAEPDREFLELHGMTQQVIELAADEVRKSSVKCFPAQ